MNIRDFSKICDCSCGTIHNAFSKPEKLRSDTLAKILELAEQHHYRPNRAAAASFHGKTRSIGVMLHDPKITYFADIAEGIQKRLLANEYLPIAIPTHHGDALPILRRLVDQRVDGIIMVDPRRELSPEERREFESIDIPCVMIEPPPESDADWVNTDDAEGGKQVAELLLRHHHRQIALIDHLSSEKGVLAPRRCGFSDRLRQEGVTPIILENAAALAPLLARADRPTAVFASSDNEAIDVYDLAAAAGLNIPDDISVAGYADLDCASFLRPRLTTVRQNGRAVGCAAAEIMLKRLLDRAQPPIHEILPVALVERDSVADAPQHEN